MAVYYVGEILCGNEDELMHYGRKGMKWGQHIFGKERNPSPRPRGSIFSRAKRAIAKAKKNRIYASKSKKPKKRRLSAVSDEELKQRIARLKLENEYLDQLKKRHPKREKKGETFIKKLLKSGIEKVVLNKIDYLTKTKRSLDDKARNDMYKDLLKAKIERGKERWDEKAAMRALKDEKRRKKYLERNDHYFLTTGRIE